MSSLLALFSIRVLRQLYFGWPLLKAGCLWIMSRVSTLSAGVAAIMPRHIFCRSAPIFDSSGMALPARAACRQHVLSAMTARRK